MTVKIITDTGCDLPDDILQTYDIDIMPLMVQLNDTTYRDRETIESQTIFDAMRNGEVPKTSQVSPLTIKETFEYYAKTKTPVLYIAFSSGLSGTYQTSVMMAEEVKEAYPDFQINVIDTKCASLGQGLVVYKVAQKAQEGETLDALASLARNEAAHMEHIFTVDDLQYLERGGRINKATAFVGSLLNIKPLLDVENGQLIPREKIRGRKKLHTRLLDVMAERGHNLENQTVAISHGDAEDVAQKLKQRIVERFGTQSVIIHQIGSAIGSHSGPGTLAIFFSNK